jgi:hypothetical protein
VKQQQALERARQRRREHDARELGLPPVPAAGPVRAPPRRVDLTCGWCGEPIDTKSRGRIPKWCSAACRQRAWEQSRAAASGRAAVQIVERRVEIPVPARTPAPSNPRHGDWSELLHQLATQLDSGAIYDRDLPDLTNALNDVLKAYERRHTTRELQRTWRRS